MRITGICIIAFVLDYMLGDPRWLYHPVRVIGHLISGMEGILRRPAKTARSYLLGSGAVLWVLVAGITTGFVGFVLYLAGRFDPRAAFVLEAFWCYQLLAAKSLKQESMKVYQQLKADDLPAARRAVAMIVGRDTDQLSAAGVAKATVETVAENTSDGVIAPLFYMLIGGAPLAFFYKAVNTMDSMLGYKNEKYRYFGRVAAKMDDFFNYIPARISAVLMVLAAYLSGLDGAAAWRIFVRDRNNHASLNSAQTEAVCAGALRIQLAGNAYYFGTLYEKPTIGDDLRPIEPEDITRAGRLMDVTAVLMLGLGIAIRLAVVWLLTSPGGY